MSVKAVDEIELFADLRLWQVVASGQAKGLLSGAVGEDGRPGVRLDFDFQGGAGFVVLRREVRLALPGVFELGFAVRGDGPANHFEFKVADVGGANAWRHLRSEYVLPGEWTRVQIRERDLPFAWGPAGGGAPGEVGAMEWAVVAGPGGKGTVFLSSFTLEDQTLVGPAGVRASSAVAGCGAGAVFQDGGKWQAAAGDYAPWWEVDFGRVQRCGGVILAWADGEVARSFRLEISEDGEEWRGVYEAKVARGKRTHVAIPRGELRLMRLVFLSDAGAELAGVELQADAFSATPNEFIHAVAKDYPRGWFPRYWYREQSYWTPVGSPLGRKRALVNEEGLVEVDEGGFSLEPFLEVDGRFISWADARVSLVFPECGAPLPEVVWEVGDLCLRVSPWMEGAEEELRLYVSYRVTGAVGLEGCKLSVAVRPFQVNPPWQAFRNLGGRSEVGEIACDVGGMQIGGVRVMVDVSADGCGAAAFEEGGVVGFLAEGKLPEREAVVDDAGLASGVVQWDLSGRGAEFCVTLCYAYGGSGAVAKGWNETLAEWQEVLGAVEWQVPECAKSAFGCFRTAAAHILINRDGAAIQPGPRRYTRSWVRDCVIMGAALAKAGVPVGLREFIEWYVQFQDESGFVPCVVDRDGVDRIVEHDSHGQLLWGIREVFRTGHDGDFVERMFPKVAAAAEYLIGLRGTRKTAHYEEGEQRACYGLLPESASHEGYLAHPVHSYWDDFWGVRGLEAAADLADVLGHSDEGARWRKEAGEFIKDVVKSMERVIEQKGLEYLPGSVEWADFDPTASSNAIAQLDFADVLPQVPLGRMLDTYLRGFRQKHQNEIPWNNYTAYEIRIIGAMVRLGRRDDAQELLEFFLSDRRPTEWNQWPEITWRDARAPGHLGDVPHTWIAAEYLLALASMVAGEREGAQRLVLGAGLAWRWIAEDDGFCVRGLPTKHGLVDLKLHALDTRRIDLEVSDRVSLPADGLVVIPPLPEGWRILRAMRSDGRVLEVLSDGSGVVIDGLPCVATIELAEI